MAITNSLVQIVCNASLQFYGGDLYVGVMTVINSVREVVMMPVNGITNGAQPVMGFNYGAGEYGRVRSGIRATAMHVYFFGFFMMALQFSGQTTFVALGKSKQAVFFSLLRKVFIVAPLTVLLPGMFSLGTAGVFLAEPISNFLGGTASFATMMLTVWKKLGRPVKTSSVTADKENREVT